MASAMFLVVVAHGGRETLELEEEASNEQRMKRFQNTARVRIQTSKNLLDRSMHAQGTTKII